MRNKKRFVALMLAGLMVAGTACGNGGSKDGGAKGENTVYNTFLNADPDSLDAQKGSDSYGNTVVNNVYEPLIRLVQNEDLTLKPEAAAKEWKVSEDAMTYTFTLRDGLKWEDGQPLTAKDFEYGIKRTVDPKTGSGSSFLLADIANFQEVNEGKAPLDKLGVKAIDDKTLEIKLGAPAQYFINIVPFRVCFPQRKDIVEKHGEQFGSEANTIVGCGPFKLTEWTHNSKLVLEKNPDYWNKDKVKLEKVNLRVITDTNTMMNAFQSGEVMSVSTNKPEWTSKFDKREGTKTEKIDIPAVDYFAVNHKDKLFKNKKVRQAFNIALDREGFNETVLKGKSAPAYFWVPKAITIEDLKYREMAGNPVKEMADKLGDPKALLSEGLKELGMDPDPSKLEVSLIMTNSPDLKKYGEYFQQNFQNKLGVKVKLEMMEWAILSGKINKGNYQMGYLAWTADYNHPSAMMSLFTSSANAVRTGWTSEEYDKLIRDAAKEKDKNKQVELYKKAEQILADETVIIPIISGTTNMYYQDYVKHINVNQFSTAGYKDTYLEKK
ncbi:Dipeptide-binding protein DppE precursor [Finegoldia magna]|uniref:Dipeptide-binding protein DppE n=1 Tax=Finegoldia magna TaxID=1260 RepID=A0A6N2Z0R5_FINMA